MSLLGIALHKKRFIPAPPPAGTGLAMPAGAVNGFGTAADFYDTVGVNVKPDAGGPYSSVDGIIADLAELGIRQARYAGGGRFTFLGYQAYFGGRAFFIRIRNRNAAIPAPTSTDRGQPIFVLLDLPGWGHPSNLTGVFGYPPNPGFFTTHFTYSMGRPYTVQEWFYGFDGGSNGWGHYDGNGGAPRNMPASHDNVGFRIPDGATSNPNADQPNPWRWTEPELDWSNVGAFSMQNEPWLGIPGDHAPTHASIKPWCQAVMVEKNNAFHAGKVVGGPPRVTETGIAQGNQVRTNQIPFHGLVVIPNQQIVDLYGDQSRGTNTADVGDIHPYQAGVTPSHERNDQRAYATNNAEGSVFNGRMASPPDPAKGLPFVCTEVGHTTATTMADGRNPNDYYGDGSNVKIQAQNHNTWPTPPDVQAEYIAQQYLLHWIRDIRRTYIYELGDYTVGEFGLVHGDRAKKPSFWAVRNMLRLTGFSEPSPAAKRKLNLSVSGWSQPTATYVDPAYSSQWWQHAQGLDQIQMQVDDNTWLLWLRPQGKLWDRGVGNWNTGTGSWQAFGNVSGGRSAPSTQTLTVSFPAADGIATVEEASPTSGLTGTNTAPYYTWSNPDDGFAWTSKSITNNTVSVPLAGRTKVLRFTKGTPPSQQPVVIPVSGFGPATLRTGSSAGPRLQLKGINVWGLPDDITNNVSISGTAFHQHQYAARATIAFVAATWGANCIRLRIQASDYNGAPSGNTDGLTKTQIMNRLADWRDAAQVTNMYLCLCSWDGLDGPYSGANWVSQSANVRQMFTDAYNRLGPDPRVFYEVTNEPNNISMANWATTMRGAIDHFRVTMGYRGVLVIDPPNWANSGVNPSGAGYNQAEWSGLQSYDASKPGMSGTPQLVFAKHDYANNYPSSTFNGFAWYAAVGASPGGDQFVIWENEFGNYNGPSGNSDTWSALAAQFFRDRFDVQTNFAGGAPFLWGPWSDANAITAADDLTPTSPWGNTVHDIYFGTGSPTPPPPPPTGFSPGIVSGADWTTAGGSADAGQSLNAHRMRVEFDPNLNPASAGGDQTFMDNIFTFFADRGIQILMLAGWQGAAGNDPGVTAAGHMGAWANRYGPGGAFWASYGGTDRPISFIEWGNETNYQYQSGDPNSAGYIQTARNYASRFQTVWNSVAGTGKAVGLLCQGTPTDTGSPSWMNELFNTVPNLASLVSGWTVHPYGTDPVNRLTNYVSHLNAHGVPNNAAIDITELGIAVTDGSITLADNYGWPTNLNYAQAAADLHQVVTDIRNASFASRIRHFMLYQAKDYGPTSNNKEFWFGGRTRANTDKGAFATEFRTIMAMT